MSNGKTHWKKFFDYNYFGTYSLDDYEGEPILTIHSIKTEDVKDQNGKTESCMVCYWVEDEKPMILNKTNCKIIEKLYGSPHIEDWVGSRIQLYSAKVKAFGTTTTGVRVRDFKPASSKEQDLKQLRKQIRTALSQYQGDDKEIIKETLNEKRKAGEDTPRFYQTILKQLKAPANA